LHSRRTWIYGRVERNYRVNRVNVIGSWLHRGVNRIIGSRLHGARPLYRVNWVKPHIRVRWVGLDFHL
jgi:hypothetical protein